MQDVLAAGIAVAEQQPPPPLRCPRCDSTDTKFCYYNNYNLSQPRHFCKACRRYWTVGGALRNVPVGGASRKPKRRPSPYSRPSAAPTTLEAGPPPASCPPPPPPPPEEERRVLDVLASDCQFENLLEGSAAVGRLPPSLQSSKERGGNDAAAAALPTEDLLGALGDSSCWANWWPDLAIE